MTYICPNIFNNFFNFLKYFRRLLSISNNNLSTDVFFECMTYL